MQFTRLLDTGDADDIPFGNVSYIIYAWGDTLDVTGDITYHSLNRGASGVVVIGDAESCPGKLYGVRVFEACINAVHCKLPV